MVDYIKSNHKNMCRFIQIEHIDAINDLDRIIKNEFIDGYIFGPNDLSGSICDLGNVRGDKVTELISSAIDKLHAHEKYTGVSTGNIDDDTLKHWHDMGIDMISAGADYAFIRDGAIKNRKKLERIHKI